MNMPVIFFSHSPLDRAWATKLKDLVIARTKAAVDVFLSSDGQSIPLGKNWVHTLEQALKQAKLMFVFLSPNSITSRWIYFESGYSYSRKIAVVPVGVKGVTVEDLTPLSLLQGFNMTSHEGLNNIIALINSTFGLQCPCDVADSDYQHIFDDSPSSEEERTTFLTSVIAGFSVVRQLGSPIEPSTVLRMIKSAGAECFLAGPQVHCHGMEIDVFGGDGSGPPAILKARLDPLLVERNTQILEALFREPDIRATVDSVRLEINLPSGLVSSSSHYWKTSRLFQTEVRLEPEGWMTFRGIRFAINQLSKELFGSLTRQDATSPLYRIDAIIDGSKIDVAAIVALLELLLDKGVLYHSGQ